MDNDSGDCVPDDTLESCVEPTVYGPTGGAAAGDGSRRRRGIISQLITRNTRSTSSTGNSGRYSIDWSHCAKTATDKSGIVTCVEFKPKDGTKGNNANVVSLSFFTGAMVLALH